MTILVLLLRLPRTALLLGRAGMLGAVAETGLLPGWLNRIFTAVDFLIAPKKARTARGDALCEALQALGPGFVKFGQALATRADLIGPEMAQGLTRLQDKMPAFPALLARRRIEEAAGQPVEELFSEFDDVAIAAASIAQVHKARLPDGRQVAVKLLRPDIHSRMSRDVSFFRAVAHLLELLAPGMRRLKLQTAVDQFAQLSEMELDLRLEAAAGGRLRDNLAHDEGIYIPFICLELTFESMLVTEWIEGVRIDDSSALSSAGHNIDIITQRAAQSFFNQVFRDGYFHADMHPGNIFVRADGVLVPIDFGIMGYLDFSDRLFLARLLQALLDRDYDMVAQLHDDAGMLSDSVSLQQFSQSLRAVADPVLGKPLGEISLGLVLGQILQISARFDISVQPQFNLLQKTMMMAEGVARSLNPQADMWHLAQPLAADWMATQFSPRQQAKLVGSELLKLARRLPHLMDQLEKTAADSSARPTPKGSASLGWIIAAILGVLLILSEM